VFSIGEKVLVYLVKSRCQGTVLCKNIVESENGNAEPPPPLTKTNRTRNLTHLSS
jgi:hypothetical protein